MPSTAQLRPALPEDVLAVAQVWHDAWSDGHFGHVPDALLPYRRLVDFERRVPQRIADTTVAVVEGQIVGFVTVHEEELEQLFVARAERGRGVADRLLQHGEQLIAARHVGAWLAVVEGNARARRFYERHGWHDTGPFDHRAEISGGTLAVPSRRYVKSL
jgi:GNAT superfamily N-acetyltransferase